MFSEIGGVREYNFLFAAHIPISLLQQTLCGHRTPSTCEHFFFAVVRAGPLPCCATSHLALRSLLLQAHCGGGHLVVVVFFSCSFHCCFTLWFLSLGEFDQETDQADCWLSCFFSPLEPFVSYFSLSLRSARKGEESSVGHGATPDSSSVDLREKEGHTPIQYTHTHTHLTHTHI